MSANPTTFTAIVGHELRVCGVVQGVGFRPMVWQLAQEMKLRGEVCNDSRGVLIRVWGSDKDIEQFIQGLYRNAPPLARIDNVQMGKLDEVAPETFIINTSQQGSADTGVAADAATCPDCLEDTTSPFSRRFRYPFTNCTNCGPRLSIIRSIPYDRAATTMAKFTQCPECQAEYDDPSNRRFHAQPNACHVCGPRAELVRFDGKAVCMDSLTQLDDVDAACTLIQRGEIIAVKGIGGFHLACDATQDAVVARLRALKRRPHKPFAMMVRDLEVLSRYVDLSEDHRSLLTSSHAPIVLIPCDKLSDISSEVAPAQTRLGFMLPYTPLHHLMLKRMDRPIVLTSGNQSQSPQCIDDQQAAKELSSICDFVLTHNRDIETRVDDSVVHWVGNDPQVLRRGRGYAPATWPMPAGFEKAPDTLALGGELKNTFCILKNGHLTLSQHIGDLENAETYNDFVSAVDSYQTMFDLSPKLISIDSHPEYLSSKYGRELSTTHAIECVETQHHHAHIAACLVDNNVPLTTQPVLGIALDGLGFSGHELWGGEFLLSDYREYQRLGTFKPVPLLGSSQAMREPWRNSFTHLMAEMGWPSLKMNFGELDIVRMFDRKDVERLLKVLANREISPKASSCGRLFDAVAAAMGLCPEQITFEGQAAMALEACVDRGKLASEPDTLDYPFAIPNLKHSGLPYIEPLAMWQALLGDLILKTPVGTMAARFHRGLAKAITHMTQRLTHRDAHRVVDTVVLTGGVFQNQILQSLVRSALEAHEYKVLFHQQIPANDGGLAVGQAAIAAAQILNKGK